MQVQYFMRVGLNELNGSFNYSQVYSMIGLKLKLRQGSGRDRQGLVIKRPLKGHKIKKKKLCQELTLKLVATTHHHKYNFSLN